MLGKDNFIFSITHLCTSFTELSDIEIEQQLSSNVLKELLPNGERAYYNRRIHGIKFNNTGNVVSDQTRTKISNKLKGCNSGEKSSHADVTIYNFKHLNGDTFSGTQYQFKKYSNTSDTGASELIHKKLQMSNNWFIVDDKGKRITPFNDNRGKNCYRYDPTVYTIRHNITNEIFTGDRHDISVKTGAGPSFVNGFITGNRKSMYGWKLIQHKEHNGI